MFLLLFFEYTNLCPCVNGSENTPFQFVDVCFIMSLYSSALIFVFTSCDIVKRMLDRENEDLLCHPSSTTM